MTASHVIGWLMILTTLAWVAYEFHVIFRDEKRREAKPRAVVELPKIPTDCIDALRARAKDDTK